MDLCLDDFNDLDLSDILQDKEIQAHSYINGSFKVAKRRSSRKSKRTCSESAISATIKSNRTQTTLKNRPVPERRVRPNTLNFFAEPARPGPLPVSIEIKPARKTPTEYRDESTPVASQPPVCNGQLNQQQILTQNASEDTIRNNNVKQLEETPTSKAANEVACPNNEVSQADKNIKNVNPKLRNQAQVSNQIPPNNVEITSRYVGLTRSASEWSINDPDQVEYCYIDGQIKEQTHSASFKFVPRHNDEVALEINDPIHVQKQDDDFWYEGINMRTGQKGVFPAYYAHSTMEDSDDVSTFSFKDETCERFNLYFLGSIEVLMHKGNDVLCQAMQKVAQSRRNTLHKSPPAFVCLLVNSSGIKMMDQSMVKHNTSNNYFTSSSQIKERTHFFRLRNVSFCGHHPRNDKYFAFITRHPDCSSRFACHVFVSEASTRPLAESVGRAFSSFYRDCMEFAHPAEDIYIE